MEDQYRIIETETELAALVTELESVPVFAVDLEADSMHHFKEKVCLLQLATSRVSVLIDPLVMSDLSALRPAFANPKIKKVFHGADYDVRSLYRDFRIEVHHLFDTQLASRFMGLQQTSLESVLNARFDVVLDKRYQKKDWSQRPLPEHMVAYAAKDACYLVPLARELERELREKKRLSWVKEECDWLRRVRPAANGNAPLFLSFKGAGRLKPGELVVLEALLQYRHSAAKAKDRPLFKTFGNASLLTLANRKPTNTQQLKATKALSPKQMKQYSRGVLAAIGSALKVPEVQHPVYPKRRAPSMKPVVSNRIRELKIWRDTKAASLDIDPSLVLTKALMCDIAKKNPGSIRQIKAVDGLRNWRIKEFGREILNQLKNLR